MQPVSTSPIWSSAARACPGYNLTAFRLIDAGAVLVADDRTAMTGEDGRINPATHMAHVYAGLECEVRGIEYLK